MIEDDRHRTWQEKFTQALRAMLSGSVAEVSGDGVEVRTGREGVTGFSYVLGAHSLRLIRSALPGTCTMISRQLREI